MSATSVVNAAAGTQLYFTNNYTLLDGAVFTGSGDFIQTGGTLTVDGTLKAPAFHWQSGNWNATAPATTTIEKNTVLHLTTGGNKDFDFRSITNQGTVNWVQGHLRAGHGSVFTNAPGATFNDLNASSYTVHNPFGDAGTFVFANLGTYTRNATGTTYFDTTFNNAGTVNLTQGDIQLRAGGTMSATSVVNAAAGTDFLFANNYTLVTGAQLLGAGNFTQTAGTLTIDGTLKATAFNWSSGNWNAPALATTTVDAGTVLNLVSGANKDFNARTILNQGTVNWHQGYLRSGNGGSFVNAPGATFNDLNASSYTVHTGFAGDGGFTFVNQGNYVRNVAGTTYFDTTFNNSGTVTLSQGDIQIRQGGTLTATGVIQAAANTNLYLTNDYTVLAGSQFTGAGSFTHTAGTLTVETLKATSFNWAGGNWNGAGTSLIDATTVLQLATGHDHDFDARTIRNFGTVNWSAGRLRSGNGGSFTNAGTLNDSSGYSVNNDYAGPTATFTNAATGTYNKTAGTSAYYIPFTNAGTINVTNGALNLSGGGTFSGGAIVTTGGEGVQLTGGTFSAAAAATGTLSWHGADFNGAGTSTFGPGLTVNINSGHDHDFDARTLLTQGIVNWSSGRLRSGNGGSLTNTGTWNDSSGYSVNNDYAGTTATFTNATGGTYTKTTGTSTYYLPFTNAGTINVTGGALNLSAGGALAGGTMLLTGGSGVQLTGGTFSAASAAAGTVAWQGANFNGTGTSTFGPGLTVNLNTGHDHDFDARTLLTQGIVNWSAGRLRSGHGGALVNTGTWNDSSGYSVNNDYTGPTATFTNAPGGTYTKTTGFSTFYIPFTNSGTLRAEGGTLRFDNTFTNSGGTLVAAGGNFSFAQALDLGTGRLGGTGTITAPSVTAGGQVSPGNSPGQLTLTGSLSLLSTSTLLVELAGTSKGTSYDFLSVGGTAVLAGQLSVTILNGFQSTLASTDTFTVVTATNLSGAFTNVVNGARLYTSDGFGSFQVNYGPASTYALNSVVLTQFAPIPEPSTYALMGLGLIIVLAAARRRRNS
jgi:fibronectin-binding autotransporter adhesin